MTTSFDFHPWKIQTRAARRTPYRVRWTVAGRQFGTSFVTMALAESFRASLITTARKGEGFDTDSGLPESMERTRRDISFYQHAEQFTAAVWPAAAAKTRVSIIETLARVVPVVVRDLAGAPDRDILRRALRKKLNQGQHGAQLDEDETKAIAWLARASRPVSALEDPSVVADVLDALAVNLNGKPAAPEYFSRRRRVLHRTLGYAVRKKRLTKNPLGKANLPEGRTPPQAPDDTLDPRAVGGPAMVADMIKACGTIGRRQGPRFQAFYGCMFYALMRPPKSPPSPKPAATCPSKDGGPPDLRRRQPRRRPRLHRPRPGPRAPRPQGRTKGRPTPHARRPAGPSARSPSRPSSSSSSAPTSRRTAPPRTGGCSGPRPATPSSPPPGGRSGRKSGPPRSPPTSSPPRS